MSNRRNPIILALVTAVGIVLLGIAAYAVFFRDDEEKGDSQAVSTATATLTPSATASPTASPTATLTATATASPTPTDSPTPTETPSPTAIPPTPTPTPMMLGALDVIDKPWQFGRNDGSVIVSRIILMPDGSISGSRHSNESSWGLEDNGQTLVFYTADGQPSTRFTVIREVDGLLVLRGMYLLNKENITIHVLQELPE